MQNLEQKTRQFTEANTAIIEGFKSFAEKIAAFQGDLVTAKDEDITSTVLTIFKGFEQALSAYARLLEKNGEAAIKGARFFIKNCCDSIALGEYLGTDTDSQAEKSKVSLMHYKESMAMMLKEHRSICANLANLPNKKRIDGYLSILISFCDKTERLLAYIDEQFKRVEESGRELSASSSL